MSSLLVARNLAPLLVGFVQHLVLAVCGQLVGDVYGMQTGQCESSVLSWHHGCMQVGGGDRRIHGRPDGRSALCQHYFGEGFNPAKPTADWLLPGKGGGVGWGIQPLDATRSGQPSMLRSPPRARTDS